MGCRHRRARTARRWITGRSSSHERFEPAQADAISVFRAVGCVFAITATRGRSVSSAICRSSPRTTARTSGRDRELFRLDATGQPAVVAGVPPDYFSATGQLWGNPHYDWERLEQTRYAWWIDRLRTMLTLVDRVRLDHFRGFVASWEVPGDATDCGARGVGKGPGRGTVRGDSTGTRPVAAAVRGRKPRRDHAGSRSAPSPVGISRVWRSCSSGSAPTRRRPTSDLTTSPRNLRRLHRHARQRYDGGLVDWWDWP